MGVGGDQKEKLKNKDNIKKFIQVITIQKEKTNKIDDNNNSLETNTDNNDKKIEDEVDKQSIHNEKVNKINNKRNKEKEIENIDNNINKKEKNKINDIITENNNVKDNNMSDINSNEKNNEEALLIFENKIKNRNINSDTYRRMMKSKTDISLKTSNSKILSEKQQLKQKISSDLNQIILFFLFIHFIIQKMCCLNMKI